MKIPAGTQSGAVFRLRGKGVPQPQKGGQRGDLHIKVSVETPQGLTEPQRQLLVTLEKQLQPGSHPLRRKFEEQLKTVEAPAGPPSLGKVK
jgi:molecular chaperone DnaJ